MWFHVDCRGAFLNMTVIKGLSMQILLKRCFFLWYNVKYFTDFPGPKVCIFHLNTWVSFLFPAAHNQMSDYRLQVTSAFHSKHKIHSKKKSRMNQMLLLDSFLNSNTNTSCKLCIYVHIYLIYCTVDFSFQSFAEFWFFLPPCRSWYSISRTLTNAGL